MRRSWPTFCRENMLENSLSGSGLLDETARMPARKQDAR
jgi:hypothetical protein